jgi:hypothetical protein
MARSSPLRGQKESRLQALPHHGDEGEPEQPAGGASGHGAADAGLQVAFDLTALPLHPEDHPGQDSGGEGHGHALEYLLAPPTELGADDIERQRCREAGQEGNGDPGPYAALTVHVTGLAQISEHDTQNQGRLEALAQSDEG